VLVRTNKTLVKLVHRLHRAGIDASQEGGGSASDSPAVAAVLSLLRLADHPDNRAAKFHVATSPLGEVVGLSAAGGDPSAVAGEVRRRLASEGYAAYLSWLRRRLSASIDAFDAARFDALIALARRHDALATPDVLRPGWFVELVESETVERPVPAEVRVMTVHKAKGLEFDAVVLAEMGRRWSLRGGEAVAMRSDPLSAVEVATVLPPENLRWVHPDLERASNWALERLVHEELCGLYVGMTRARRLLEMVVPMQETKKGELPLSPGGVVRAALGIDAEGEPGGGVWAWHSPRDRPWHDGLRREDVPGAETVRVRVRPGGEDLPWRRKHRSPSGFRFGEEVGMHDLLAPEHPETRRGTLLHAWFERVEWLDEGEPTDPDLERAARDLGFDDWREHVPAFRAALAGALGACLRRSHYAGRPADRITVVREREFACSLGGDEPVLLSGRFDRVVIGWRGGRPAWAEVVDFKSDRGTSAVELVRRYTEQMQAYRGAACRLWGLEPAAVSCLLAFLSLDRAVPV
jgi:ATP-dependent helicase/nuclease subunit A